MGNLVTGDFVFDEHGSPTRVTAAFDIMHDHKCYEVIFSDGSSLIADAEHEWITYTCTDRRRSGQQLTDTYKAKNFVTADKMVMLDQLIASSTSSTSLSAPGAVALIGGHKWSVFQAARKIEPINPGKRPACYPRLELLTSLRRRLARDLNEQRRDDRAYSLVTTQQMAATLTVHSSARANHAIPIARPLTLPDAGLPIDPYFLGVWLGDGSSRNNQITSVDPDLITEIEKAGYTVRSLRSNTYLYAVDDENGKAVSRWQPGMTGRLRALGLVQNKHIPTSYLRASEQQRRALLAGLLDTDGTVSHCGATEFTTTNPQLAQDVYELVCSLGFRPTLREGRARLRGKDCGPKWMLAFTTDQQVFRLKRKILAHKERLRNYNPERNRFRYVVEVREVSSRPVRCIQVESPSHLYLAGRSMIPTHNSLAYLVPVVRSGQVAIISTANKALQEQLFYKDIPFVQKYIRPFGAALVKGMGNYICIDRVESERVGLQFYAKNREFQRLVELINDPDAPFNGDIETLGFQLPADVRGRVVTDGDQCAWSKCDYFGDCYVRQMRENAQKARVIVVNHTLLLLDAAMDGFLLPERDVIILDEAHHLEEEATRCFTITIGPAQIQTLLAQRMLKDHSLMSLQDEARRNAEAAWMLLEQVADPGIKGRANLHAPFEEGLRLATSLSDLADSLHKQRPKDLPDKESQLYDKLLKRTQNLAENIRTVFSVAQPDKFVYYIERVEGSVARGFVLQASAAPLDVTSWLKESLFNKCNVICTSATLATVGPNPVKPQEKGPNFGYFRQRVGLDPQERSNVLERILPLTFDYESNALLYLPRDLPAPVFGAGSEDYTLAIAREMYKLVRVSRGRAFLLFSSKRMLDQAYELMSPHLPYPLLKQGDMPRVELTRRFRQEEGAVLFGLKSFWEGVDIAGDALSLVVIDKLPFDPPDDPVHEARINQMKAKKENWFGIYVLPQAVLRLKQGLGRLLRTREDRGVMAILDTRLHTKGYGRLVLEALPPARRTSSLRDIDRFFAET
jgi:Rad3-related DNA helicase